MKKWSPNLLITAGSLLFVSAVILRRFTELPNVPLIILLCCAIALDIGGGVAYARSPQGKASKLRQWKLRLIGKGESR